MNSFKCTNLLVLGLALTFAAVGCKKKPYGVTPLPGARAGGPTEPPPGGILGNTAENIAAGPSGLPSSNLNPEDYNQDRATLAADTVYFDFDSTVVKDSEKSKVDAVASYLKSNSSKALLVEGHCDERGTEEYNRSLGERRALALREALAVAGADPQKMATRSFGEDRPMDPGHDESAWRKNRRGEFVVLIPK
jgi:peptidoglycan-associated lipoprotein